MLRILASVVILVSVISCGSSRKATNLRSQDFDASRTATTVVSTTVDGVQNSTATPSAATSMADARAQHSPATSPMPAEPEPQMSQIDSILAYAKTFIGTPYQWAANGPSSFDCSGFVKYVFNHFGYELPRTSTNMSLKFPRVESWADLRPGDLIFFGERNNIRKVGHVGIIYSLDEEHGSFFFIHASVNNGVEIQRYTNPYYMMRYIGAGRVIE